MDRAMGPVFRSEKMVDDELEGLVVLSRSFLIRNKLAEAQAAIQQARPLSANSQNPANHLMSTLPRLASGLLSGRLGLWLRPFATFGLSG
jgi:hypothetical protein